MSIERGASQPSPTSGDEVRERIPHGGGVPDRAHVWFLESLDRVNRAVQCADDVEAMMRDVLDVVLEIFDVDVAGLVYPCDPDAPVWTVSMFRTTSAFAEQFAELARGETTIPRTPDAIDMMRLMRATDGPVQFGPDPSQQPPAEHNTLFAFQSSMAQAVYPKRDRPYLFGVAQARAPRVWTADEERLFEEIGRRLADALTSLGILHELRARDRGLRESTELFHVLADSPSHIVTLLDLDGHFVYASPSAYELLGAFPQDSAFGTVHPDDLPAAQAVWERLRAGERTTLTYRARRADGTWAWVETWGSQVEYRGAPHVLAITRDVTERARAREEIRAREARFRALVEHNDDLICIVDETARALYVSPSYARVFGYPLDEIYAMPALWPLVHPDDLTWIQEQFAAIMHQPVVVLPRPVRALTKDGRERRVALMLTDRRDDPAVGGIIGNGRDVTDELLLEEQLRQALKMEAVGRLAGGIAHDFNNLLTVISGYSEFIRAASPPGDERRDDADEITYAADRATMLTRQLLAFSRKQVLHPEVLAINAVVEEASRLLERLIGEDVTLVLRLAADAGAIRIDVGQLQQVMMNLAVNARDAMPNGGRVTIETAHVTFEREAPAQPAPMPPGRYARLTVRDTGLGMTPEVRAHAFEPFFTTKAVGKGTGLGLSTVYGIVTQSLGHLRLDSAPGRGTAVEIFFPSVEASAVPAAATEPRVAARGVETVLLVEDDAMVRRLTDATLERAGYQVLVAATGADALRLAAGRVGTIDLVVTDVVMPGMPGPELVRRLEASHPGIAVLYVSGYADDMMARHGVSEDRVSFLPKPFSPGALLRRVREVLDAEG